MISLLMPPRAARPVARPIAGQGDQATGMPPPASGGPAQAPGMFNYSGASLASPLHSLLPQNPMTGVMPNRIAQAPMQAPQSQSGTLLSSLLSRLRRGSFNAF